MFRHLQRFSFINKDNYLHKAFEEDILDPNVGKNLRKYYLLLDSCEQSNMRKNILRIIDGKIQRKNYKTNNQFLQKKKVGCCVQIYFITTVDIRYLKLPREQ